MSHGAFFARSNRPPSLQSPANDDPGLFGSLFPNLTPLQADPAALAELAAAMIDQSPSGTSGIPAGFTYLGQFIDHDITFDITSLGDQLADPDGLENFRTPALDLDSVYGLGPSGTPHLFERVLDGKGRRVIGARLLVGTAEASPAIPPGQPADIPAIAGTDLPRSPVTGTALIGDPRNDENLIVAQTHVAFLRFHNAVVDRLAAGQPATAEDFFDEARKIVTWHYQWIVLHEFLDLITGQPGIADRILQMGRRHFRFRKFPFMPREFSVAAYRFGHSLVREDYSFNRVFRPGGLASASLDLLFEFTAKSGSISGASGGGPVTLPSRWVIDWRRFYDFGIDPPPPGFHLNRAMPIDPKLVPALHALPGSDPEQPTRLAFLNLMRGVKMRLPSGQAVARDMGIAPMSAIQIGQGPDGEIARKHGLDTSTPLWYYILKEAEQLGGGRNLGPVAATIVAEVFVGLVQGSPSSYLSARPTFVPFLPSAVPGTFKMTDLLTLAGGINPLGDG